jgi:hypothetical protein
VGVREFCRRSSGVTQVAWVIGLGGAGLGAGLGAAVACLGEGLAGLGGRQGAAVGCQVSSPRPAGAGAWAGWAGAWISPGS